MNQPLNLGFRVFHVMIEKDRYSIALSIDNMRLTRQSVPDETKIRRNTRCDQKRRGPKLRQRQKRSGSCISVAFPTPNES